MVEITSFPTMIVAARAIVAGAFATVTKVTNQYIVHKLTMTLTGAWVQKPIYIIVLRPSFLELQRSNWIAAGRVILYRFIDANGPFT